MRESMLVFIGTYTDPILFGTGKILQGKGEGIYLYRLDLETGALSAVRTTKAVTNPSFLGFDPARRFLFAVNELKSYEGSPTGTVSAFSIDPADASLKFINKKPTRGTDPCHVETDATGRFAVVANYMSGSVCVFPVLENGALGDPADFVQHSGSSLHPQRQTGPHAHSVVFDRTNRHIFVPDLGKDELVVYAFDQESGKLEPEGSHNFKAKAGSGPRHIAFHPDGGHAYLINELDSSVTALSYDAGSASFGELQTVSTLPPDFRGASSCADLHVAPSGEFLYASNRGHDSIAVFRIDGRSGKLEPAGHAPTLGNTPRNFALDPAGRFLLAANQDSDNVVAFRIDQRNGMPVPTGHVANVPTPVCVRIV